MTAELQKAMDYALIGLTNTFFFPDDIIIASKGSEENHVKLVTDYLQQLDADNLRINLPRCHFAQPEILWLTCNITQSGISPLELKTSVNYSHSSSALQPFKTTTSKINKLYLD